MSNFNSKIAQFDWKEFTLELDGRIIVEVTDVEWTVDKNIEEIYAAGNDPWDLGEGNKTYKGTIEVLQSGYEALVTEAKKRGGDDITDLEVDGRFAHIPKGGKANLLKTIVDMAEGIKFTSGGKKITQGSTHIKVSLPFKARKIKPQI
jgi:hypothetical protein